MEGDLKEKLLKLNSNNGGVSESSSSSFKRKLWIESKKMWVVAAPAIFTRFSTFGVTVITQAFVGHIGSTELAALSVVFTVLLRFANGILLGMASALETLCGQAYGAGQYHMLGVYLQRSWIILICCTFCLLPMFLLTTPILSFLGQETDITRVAGEISLWLVPVLFSSIASYTSQMFLQAQSRNRVITYFAAFSMALHLFLSWILTVKLGFGLSGAMASTVLAFWIPNIGQLGFITCGGCKETWRGFSTLAFRDLMPVLKLSLSSGVMLCLELWYNSVLVLLTGNLVNAEISIDALAICLNVNGWEMMISLGFLAAASVRVSNELGRGSSNGAKFSAAVTVLTSFGVGLVMFIVFLFLRGQISYIFTKNIQVAKAVEDLSPLLAFSILLNSVQPVLSGIAIGTGRQSTVAYINIACYYLVGIPVGLVLGYVFNMQVKGVWVGMLFGTFVQTMVLTVTTFRTDWDKQVVQTRNRVNKWFVPETEEPTSNNDV